MDFNVLVLISGRGSNLKSLIDRAEAYRVSAVVSNNPEAGGLQYARDAGIPAYPFARSEYASLSAFKEAIFRKVADLNPNLIALAGFMQVIQPEFVTAFSGRMINIHPSLLPSYPGLDTHKRVVAAKEPVHGCTVHFVDTGVDTGPIIAQARCELCPDDTEESAAAKVLRREHELYPWVVNGIARRTIAFEHGRVRLDDSARAEAHSRGFTLPH